MRCSNEERKYLKEAFSLRNSLERKNSERRPRFGSRPSTYDFNSEILNIEIMVIVSMVNRTSAIEHVCHDECQ
jgi:hypothetical protein